MTDLILKSILLAAVSALAANYFWPPIVSFFKGETSYFRKSVKPFECAYCHAFWLTLCHMAFVGELWAVPLACFAAVFAALIDKKI